MDLKREITRGKELFKAMRENPDQGERVYLEFLTRENLRCAIEQADHDGITKSIETLKAINAIPLSFDEIIAIHRCREKILKGGPKKKSNPLHRAAVGDYKSYCVFPELAWVDINRDKKAFEPETVGEVLIQHGTVLPVWKYPHMERERRRFPLPSKEKIRRFICKRYGIGARTLDALLSEDSKKNSLLFYRRLVVHEHVEHEEARRQTLQATLVRSDNFDRWLQEDRNSLFL